MEKSENRKPTREEKFRAAACAVKCWDEAGGDWDQAERLFSRRHGDCESVLIWLQIGAALIQIAYTIWKWRKDNKGLLHGEELDGLLAMAERGEEVQQ